ncbi:MAG TPA: lysophospholipid acyltransferase family protein [Vicinamibacteria bacterium]
MRVLWSVPFLVLVTLGLGIPATLAGLVDRRGDLSWRIARSWGRVVLQAWGVRVVVLGAAPPPGPVIYAVNHGSVLDIPVLFAYLPGSFRIVHKRSLYLIPLIGLYLYCAGHIGIDRSKAFRARKSLERAAQRIAGGTSVAVFPEGTRSSDGTVHSFKKGSFVLAIEAGVPVIPVSLAGVKRVAPQGLLRLRPGELAMTLHPPVPTSGRGVEEAAALAEQVRGIVARGCAAA